MDPTLCDAAKDADGSQRCRFDNFAGVSGMCVPYGGGGGGSDCNAQTTSSGCASLPSCYWNGYTCQGGAPAASCSSFKTLSSCATDLSCTWDGQACTNVF